MHVVVTGANRGIGAALSGRFTERGDTVTGTSRGGDALARLDVTDPASISEFAAGFDLAPVDLLVCNAGVYLDRSETLETGFESDLWAKTFAANVTGVFLCVQALLPNLRAAKTAKIAIISSQMGSSARAKGSSLIYRASKAAALNLGFNLASALRPEGIAVGIYHPGWVRTDMGGATADISVDESADGLVARFDALTIDSTGCFENWDGRAHPV